MASCDETNIKESETNILESNTNVHGENVSERMKKYQVQSDTPCKDPVQTESSKNSSNEGSYENSVFSDDSGKFFLMDIKVKSSPTNSAAGRIMKSRGRSYEQLAMVGGKPGRPTENSHIYDRLCVNGNSPESVHNGINTQDRTQIPQSVSSSKRDLEPITIPKDGNIQHFTVDELSLFFRWMNINENIVQKLNTKQLDGRKFSKLKDKTLEEIGIKNPIILYFRDKSSRIKINFML